MDGEEEGGGRIVEEVAVSEFEYSVDKFFEVSDTISSLCGEEPLSVDSREVQRSSSEITFLKEWKYFYYEPKIVNFAYEAKSPGVSKYAAKGIRLPHFSSVSIPKTGRQQMKESSGGKAGTLNCEDFLLHAGGSVWALDWCPRVCKRPDSHNNCEYLAVAAHPPGSSYHQMGLPLTGRGIIQIWCILNAKEEGESLLDYNYEFKSSSKWRKGRPQKSHFEVDPLGNIVEKRLPPKPRGRPRKQPIAIEYPPNSDGEHVSPKPKRPRGRPRKQLDGECQSSQPKRPRGRPRKQLDGECTSQPKRPRGRPRKQPESAKFTNISSETEVLTDVLPLPACGFDRDADSYRSACLSEGDTIASGDSMLRSKVDENFECSAGLPVQEKSCPPKLGRGRRKKASGLLKFLDAIKNSDELGESAPTVHASNEVGRNICEESGLRFQADEKITGETLGGLSSKGKQSITRWGRGRPRKKPAGVESADAWRGQSLAGPTEDSARMESLDVLNGVDVLNVFEVEEDGPLSLSRSELVSTSHGTSEIRSCERNKQPSETCCLDKGKFSPSGLCKVNTRKGSVETNPIDDINAVENLNIATSYTPSILLDINTLVSPGATASELVREPSSATLKTCNSAVGLTVQECKESNPQNLAPEYSAIRCPRKRKIKDNARKVTSGSVAPIFSTINDEKQLCVHDNLPVQNHGQDLISEAGHVTPLKISCSDNHKNVALPRVVLCLAHMGKVAWDVKWRPCSANNLEENIYALGYLAAVLGDGSLEVWEIPLPGKVKILYNSYDKEAIDPRFIRLKPVFRCSVLKCGDRQSIPLTVEWSPGSPNDLILAGCHDGTVALWKFITNDSSPDTRPLICFRADNVPIRAVAWAPNNSDTESANLFVTAGNERLRFWDMRDPYCPLWDFNPVKRHILSVDWFRNPSCIMLSFDDGALRIISLSKAVSEVPVTGELLAGAKGKHHYYFRSAFPIWSAQVSRITGQVAYCGADGLISRFQLTVKAVEKDSSRNREPHFLCGSLVEEDQSLCINIPLPNVPLEDTPRHGRSLRTDLNHPRIENRNAAGDSLAMVPFSGSSQQNTSCKTVSKLKGCQVEKDGPTEITNLICAAGDKEEGNVQGGEIHVGLGETRDVFPSKNVAMHKVRWNMNHGSERWLCYGGAAGIVRCQQISLPDL